MEPTCADAQVALGTVLFLSDWNWVGAQRSLERALELDPDHTAYPLYGRLLEALGEVEKGLAAKQKALERNPSSALVHTQIALSIGTCDSTTRLLRGKQSARTQSAASAGAPVPAGAYWKKGDFDRQMAEGLKHAERMESLLRRSKI